MFKSKPSSSLHNSNLQVIQQSPVHHLREHFLLFHSIYNTLQCTFAILNDSRPILANIGPFLSSSKVSQVQAFIIRNRHHIQLITVHRLREHFLPFHSISKTLQCSFPLLNDLRPILAYLGQFPTYSKVSQVQAFINQNWQDKQQSLVQHL